MATKVAVVTGSNEGIGYAVVHHFCEEFDGVVYLTAKDVECGKKAVEELNKEDLKPEFHQLDVTDKKSVETFRDYIKSKYEGIDVLVNNAAIVLKHSATEPVSVQAEQTLDVNYFSLVSTCDILFPLLKNGAQVYNIHSPNCPSSFIPSKDLKDKLRDEKLTVPELSKLMQQYVDAVKEGTHVAEWGNSSYVVSKEGVIALSNIQQRTFNGRDIKVNSAHEDTNKILHRDKGGLPLIIANTTVAAIVPSRQGSPGPSKQARKGKPTEKPAKRPRSDGSLSSARLPAGHRVAVILDPYHDLTKEQADAIEGQLQSVLDEKILSAASSGPALAQLFRGKVFYSEGVLKIWCYDDNALKWLQQSLKKIASPREGTELVIKKQSDILKRIKAGLLVPQIGPDETQVQIQTRLKYQNREYNVANWAFYHAYVQEEKKSVFLVLGIPEKDVLKLKASDFRVYYKLDNLYLHFLDERPAHQQALEEQQTALQSLPPNELENLLSDE